jgi:hypothetical protein
MKIPEYVLDSVNKFQVGYVLNNPIKLLKKKFLVLLIDLVLLCNKKNLCTNYQKKKKR